MSQRSNHLLNAQLPTSVCGGWILSPRSPAMDDDGGGSSSSVSVLWYGTSKRLGKVRRRVQELRFPSSGPGDTAAARPPLDLSHNESARLAVDGLLCRGLEGYHEALSSEGEADFLSELEKNYILENGREGNTDEPGGCGGDDNKVLQSSSDESDTHCPSVSTGRHPEGTCEGQINVKDVRWADPVLGEPRVYFPSNISAAGMKDLVREFIRKATMALGIVMDSFTDVELLCDLLEASRKRNVSVHLLLDRLHLGLFVTMWLDLKLNGKNFPKLSVRSVEGQTYCAKTGRKLTGRVAESFIISDWTEVLTGSYSFSWLSWQVHRSLVVHLTGGSAPPFCQEFHRLDSGSKPVPGFVTFITVPRTLPLYVAAHPHDAGAARCLATTVGHWDWTGDALKPQTTTKRSVLSNPKSPALEYNKDEHHLLQREGAAAQTHTERTVCYQTTLKNSNLDLEQRNRNRLTKTPAGVNAPKPQTSQQQQAKTSPQFPLTRSRGYTSGLRTNSPPPGTRRQDHLQGQRQPPGRTRQPPAEAPGSTATGPQLGPRQLQPHSSQQAKPPPRLNWIHAARPSPVARTSSFDSTYWTGQRTTTGRRPDMNMLLRRNKSLMDRRSTLNHNMTT